MLFSLGFVSIFVTGGSPGLFLGQPQIDAYFHDTYFVVAHFHLIMGIAALFGIFAATFYWFPLMFGRMLNERLGKLHFYLTFVLAYATFLPMHFAGFAGNPRRYSDFTTFDFLAAADAAAALDHVLRLRAGGGSADLSLESVPQHLARRARFWQPVERDESRMVTTECAGRAGAV